MGAPRHLPRCPAQQLRRMVRHRPRRDGHPRTGVAGRRLPRTHVGAARRLADRRVRIRGADGDDRLRPVLPRPGRRHDRRGRRCSRSPPRRSHGGSRGDQDRRHRRRCGRARHRHPARRGRARAVARRAQRGGRRQARHVHARWLHVRHRPVARHAATPVRRAVRPGRFTHRRPARPRSARPAVPVPLEGWSDADRRRRPRRDRRGVRGVLRRGRRAVALLRRSGPADLGRGRAHLPRRSDDGPRVAREEVAVAVRRDRDRSVPHAAPLGRLVLRRRPTRAVGRSLCHLLGLLAVPGAGHAGVHPAHRGALRVLVPAGRAGHDPRARSNGSLAMPVSRSGPAPRSPR